MGIELVRCLTAVSLVSLAIKLLETNRLDLFVCLFVYCWLACLSCPKGKLFIPFDLNEHENCFGAQNSLSVHISSVPV